MVGIAGRGKPVLVAVGEVAPLIGHGLRHALDGEHCLRLVGLDLDRAALEVAVVDYGVQVVVLDERSVAECDRLVRDCAGRTDVGVLVLANRPSRAFCLRVLGLGARACLSKDASLSEIVSAVLLVAAGGNMFVSARDGSGSVNELGGMESLTARQRSVLNLLGAGLSNAEIALELRVTVETVRTHVAHIYRKLGVNSRRELIGVELLERDAGERRSVVVADAGGGAATNGVAP